jgi:membrane protein YdbS with pleckstrin-like domain
VPDLTIRPTAKFLKAGVAITALVFLALEIAYFTYWRGIETVSLLPLVVPLIFIWPLARWMRWRTTKATVSGDRLRYESGLAGKSTRTIQLTKLQDVRVDQGLFDRLFDIGDISLETSGETSRLTIPKVDRPQQVADELLNRSHPGTTATAP